MMRINLSLNPIARIARSRAAWLRVLGLVLLAHPALAQEISINLGDGQSFSLRTVQLFLLDHAPQPRARASRSWSPAFPFMVTVLSILRQAIGVQQAPPNMMIVSLALFLTYFVMEPVFTQAWRDGIEPMVAGEMQPEAGLRAGDGALPQLHGGPRRSRHRRACCARRGPRPREAEAAGDTPLSLLVPSFLLSEIRRGFEVGFLIFLPFLVIDLVIAAVLMSMGMMMVPPAVVSLPFKLAFFVIADGWSLLAGALVRSYNP